MLARLFRKSSSAPGPKAGPQMAMIAFRSAKGLSDTSIAKAWAALFPRVEPLVPQGKPDKGTITFETGSRTLLFSAMPAPIPAGDIEHAAQLSWMWKDAAAAMAAHTLHAIAVCIPSGQDDTVQDALALTRLLAAAAKAGDTAGIYWGNASQLHKPEFFIDAIKDFDGDDGTLPTMLWVGILISGESAQGPFTLSTRGMEPLGHKEMEIIGTHMPVGPLRMFVYETINYLLNAGPVLEHGHTFGRTATEKFRVEHTKSAFNKGQHVIRLHVP